MKKFIALLLFTIMILALLSSCSNKKDDVETVTKMRIGTLSGPTGMGMAKMISDFGLDSDKYTFTVFGSPAAAQDAFIAGDIDAICLPTNNAASLNAKMNNKLCVAAINCLGSLYVVSGTNQKIESINDLEGKTIYASVPNSTTGAIINHILTENKINATVSFEYKGEVLSDHDQLSVLMGKGEIDLAILPEPKATATILNNPDLNLKIALNLSTEWENVSDETEPLTMGCIVFKKDFVNKNKSLVNEFLDTYKRSIEYIGDPGLYLNSPSMIVNAGILPNEAIAKQALSNLYGSIVYIDGKEMQTALEGFYNVIGLPLPDDDFYYER